MPSLSPRTRLATMAASSAATAHLWQSANAFNDSSLQAVPKVSTFDVRILRLFVKAVQFSSRFGRIHGTCSHSGPISTPVRRVENGVHSVTATRVSDLEL